MKKLVILIMLIPFLGITQTIENIDYISPFNNGVAAVKRADKWAFIDDKGQIMIDFRNDLVTTKTNTESYPLFSNDRCLIVHDKEGVLYYGYIDKMGKTVISPQFLNASNFNHEKALALKVEKEIMGYNNVFKKDMVNYHYFEVIINNQGVINQELTQLAIHTPPSEKNTKNLPSITSKIISSNLVAVKASGNKWIIKKIN